MDYFMEEFSNISGDSLFFLGTQHDIFKNLIFPSGSIVIDPFRYMPDIEDSNLIKIGNWE